MLVMKSREKKEGARPLFGNEFCFAQLCFFGVPTENAAKKRKKEIKVKIVAARDAA